MAIALALLLAGCANTAQPPVFDTPALPAAWSTSPDPQAGRGPKAVPAVADGWWRGFGSEALSGLVARAQAQSFDLAAAVARVRQAEASAHVAGSALWPALTASVEAKRSGRLVGHPDLEAPVYGTELVASYEIDFWGRNRLASDAARASWRASGFDRDTVRLTLVASVASAWLQTVGLQERADIAEGNLANAERLLALVASRRRAGAATALEQAQQRGVVAAQRRTLAELRQQAVDGRITLGLLLGQAAPVDVPLRRLAPLQLPAAGAGLPADLLARRPDVARAEARLAAAAAHVGAARAAMLPDFVLTAGIGSGGARWRRWLDSPFYSLAAGLTAPIFDAGRLSASHALAEAQQQALLAGYQAAISAAVGDVEAALNTGAGLDAQAAAQVEELDQAQRAFLLAESRWRAGAETLLSLLDTQRTLYAAQNDAARLRQAQLVARVALFRALGGGWQRKDGEEGGRGKEAAEIDRPVAYSGTP